MTITARNYAAQAAASLRFQAGEIVKLTDHQSIRTDAFVLSKMANDIEDSVHFAMPDGGKIFDDQLRGIQGKTIRLPFPAITIECFFPDGGEHLDHTRVAVKKRLVFARNVKTKSGPAIDFHVFCCHENGAWVAMTILLSIPFETAIPKQDQFPKGLLGLDAEYNVWLPGLYRLTYEKDPNEKFEGAIQDVLGDVLWSLELLEALSCSNVSHQPIEAIDPRKNAKRIKAGKLPIYETRILTIEAGKSTQSSQSHGGTHASPRQHLRRGHIRRLADKNIWVNSCVVGKAETGVIEKQYHVRAA